jgi:hypothetical protein
MGSAAAVSKIVVFEDKFSRELWHSLANEGAVKVQVWPRKLYPE